MTIAQNLELTIDQWSMAILFVGTVVGWVVAAAVRSNYEQMMHVASSEHARIEALAQLSSALRIGLRVQAAFCFLAAITGMLLFENSGFSWFVLALGALELLLSRPVAQLVAEYTQARLIQEPDA